MSEQKDGSGGCLLLIVGVLLAIWLADKVGDLQRRVEKLERSARVKVEADE